MTNKSVTKCGLFVSNSGMLAGSPDGSVYECGELLLLEIKCPWKHRNNSVRHAALSDKQFFLAISKSGELYLKPDHHYMHQIQGCMHLANANKCHFVVWTLKSIEVILVFRDPTWNLFLSQLESFFVEFMLPIILKK